MVYIEFLDLYVFNKFLNKINLCRQLDELINNSTSLVKSLLFHDNQPPNPPNPPPAWRAISPLNLKPPLHDLPQAFEKMLPKFDPSEKILVDDHPQSFYLAIEGLRAGEYEDVVCRLFPHTLKGAAASWYFGLPANSIPDWDTFERIFKVTT